jgi:uncharacterized membrane protein YdbT with pleckstrin-like domain
MGYIEQSLSSGEQVILKARLHWGMFVGPVFRLLIGVGLVLVAMTPALGSVFTFAESSPAREAIPPDMLQNTAAAALVCNCLAWAWLLGGVLQLFSRAGTFFSTEFAVTNKRVIGKSGWLRRHSLEVMLSKVESISVSEPLLGRLLNFGTIVVRGSGGTMQPFPFISNAMTLRREINNLMPAA